MQADDEGKFDAFLGNDSGVLAGSGAYDEEDREADQIWEQVDQRMEERRKVGMSTSALVGASE